MVNVSIFRCVGYNPAQSPQDADSTFIAPHQQYPPPQNNFPQPGGYGPPTQYYPDQYRQQQHDMSPHGMVPSQSPVGGYPPQRIGYISDSAVQRMAMGSGQPQGMFTRNLIGSLATSASRLTDPNEKIGIWFILQDLSVRTEGNFR